MSTKKSIICFFTCIFAATILTSCTGEGSSNDGYIDGNCEDLKSRGLSDFGPGDPNYTNRRDGDADGVACESD